MKKAIFLFKMLRTILIKIRKHALFGRKFLTFAHVPRLEKLYIWPAKSRCGLGQVGILSHCLLPAGLWTSSVFGFCPLLLRSWFGVLIFDSNCIFAWLFFMLSLPHQLQVQVIKKKQGHSAQVGVIMNHAVIIIGHVNERTGSHKVAICRTAAMH